MDANIYTCTSPFSTQSVKRRGDSPSYMGNDGKGSTVDKKYCFRMMVWLCAYYEFYDKKVQQSPSQWDTIYLLTPLPCSPGNL